jgi:hypothetical protein
MYSRVQVNCDLHEKISELAVVEKLLTVMPGLLADKLGVTCEIASGPINEGVFHTVKNSEKPITTSTLTI